MIGRLPAPHELETTVSVPLHEGRYMAVIYNNDYNSVDDVVSVVMSSTNCTLEEAAIEVWEAHHYGKAPVHFDTEETCNRIAREIMRIGVVTEVVPEWKD